MISTLGQALVLASIAAATVGAMVAFAGGIRRSLPAMAWARRLAYLFSALMVGANLLMIYALLTHDFSVSYVAHVGSKSTPTWVTIVSLWSSLEGSILFWGAILGLYVALATFATRNKYPEYMPWALGMMLVCSVFFSFLIAGPANPFIHVPNPPSDGPGPNALLQNHILMVIHPPALYLGYVGMVVPFSMAVAALFAGRLGHEFLRPLRTWLLVPWTFLTMGIVLGGWWAYEVLGWGGYWAWDPVENASLLPWLTATAAVHSIMVVERKGLLKGWTLTLILSTFLLTILGTFMTRSGVFNSVHSFTQSDIGPTFLVFLAACLVFSVFLLAARIQKLEAEGRVEDVRSRESAFLVNNLLFVMLTLTVLLGTVFPLLVEAIKGQQISVGEPYFNRMAVPMGVAVLFLMGIGPALPWGKATAEETKRALLPPFIGGVVLLALGLALGARSGWLLVTLFCGGYAAQVTGAEMLLPVKQKLKGGRSSFGGALATLFGSGRRRFGAYVVHVGVALILVAVGVSSTQKQAREFSMTQGQSAALGPYELTFEGATNVRESHRRAIVARVAVKKDGKDLGTVLPRMNFYFSQREPIGTPEVLTTLKEDLYLSVMSVDADRQVLGLRAFINPMVVWIWIGAGIMLLGSILAIWPRRSSRAATVTAPSGAPAPALAESAGKVG